MSPGALSQDTHSGSRRGRGEVTPEVALQEKMPGLCGPNPGAGGTLRGLPLDGRHPCLVPEAPGSEGRTAPAPLSLPTETFTPGSWSHQLAGEAAGLPEGLRRVPNCQGGAGKQGHRPGRKGPHQRLHWLPSLRRLFNNRYSSLKKTLVSGAGSCGGPTAGAAETLPGEGGRRPREIQGESSPAAGH